ncbi:hypothetical protein ABZ512_16770 [Nocardiopsis dassonvillei]|uniref:hypothetical protein n=1 Tax=Nocardiopsis dassonvillei TaxID=2014 RepID=UPI0033ED4822
MIPVASVATVTPMAAVTGVVLMTPVANETGVLTVAGGVPVTGVLIGAAGALPIPVAGALTTPRDTGVSRVRAVTGVPLMPLVCLIS